MKEAKPVKSWKKVKTMKQLMLLSDQSLIMRWSEMTLLKKRFRKREEEKEIISYFAKTFCENLTDRYVCEVTTENILIWLSHPLDENHIHTFVAHLFRSSNSEASIRTFVEIALTSDMSEKAYAEKLTATAVTMISEMGKYILNHHVQQKKTLKNQDELLSHITTYLLSVSNLNHYSIRLSLFHYFGYASKDSESEQAFEKIMNRFGFTVLDYLFSLLFKRKSESVAQIFLLENIPFVFKAESHTQQMLHQIFKYYMLKKPEKFLIFLNSLTHKINAPSSATSQAFKKIYLQHLGTLFKVASDIHHREISLELMGCILKMQHPFRSELLATIHNDEDLHGDIKEMVKHMSVSGYIPETPLHRVENSGHLSLLNEKSPQKRGRKSRIPVQAIGTIDQISALTSITLAKAS